MPSKEPKKNVKIAEKIGSEPQLNHLVKCPNIPHLDAQSKPKEEHCCSVCRQKFPTFMTFWWHEQRHVGEDNFKCTVCSQLVDSPKACWTHELKGHEFAAKPFLYDPTEDPEPEQISEPEAEAGISGDGKKDEPSMAERLAAYVFDVQGFQKMCLEIKKNLPWFCVGSRKPLPFQRKMDDDNDNDWEGIETEVGVL